MRSTLRLRALVLALSALALLVGAPGPARASDGAGPLGGPLLTGTGEVLGVGAPPVPKEVVAHGWVVADLDTGAVLGARNPHGRYAPASTLKILTAITLGPRIPKDARLVPTFDDLNVDGSKVGLVERVAYPVDELFTAMMMVSGNDVANTLASAVGRPQAIDAMNAEAQRLQALDTHAVNPSGLDADGQLSSAYDLALLGRAGMTSPDFRRWVATRSASVSGPGGKRIETYNHDKLLGRYDGALGIKNGYTTKAKASFVGAATRDGRTILVTMMRTQPRVDVEARALLDWGFAAAAAGAQPVGTLVDPVGDGPVASAPAVDDAVVTTPVAGAARRPAAGSGGLPLQTLAAAGGAAALLLLRRRRKVVLARTRPRATGPRAAPPRGGPARAALPRSGPQPSDRRPGARPVPPRAPAQRVAGVAPRAADRTVVPEGAAARRPLPRR